MQRRRFRQPEPAGDMQPYANLQSNVLEGAKRMATQQWAQTDKPEQIRADQSALLKDPKLS